MRKVRDKLKQRLTAGHPSVCRSVRCKRAPPAVLLVPLSHAGAAGVQTAGGRMFPEPGWSSQAVVQLKAGGSASAVASMTQKLNRPFSAPLGPLNYSSSNSAPEPTMQWWWWWWGWGWGGVSALQTCCWFTGRARRLCCRSSRFNSSSHGSLARET